MRVRSGSLLLTTRSNPGFNQLASLIVLEIDMPQRRLRTKYRSTFSFLLRYFQSLRSSENRKNRWREKKKKQCVLEAISIERSF